MTKFISLKTNLPGPKSQEIANKREKYVAKPMGGSLSPCYIAHGEGALVTYVSKNKQYCIILRLFSYTERGVI